MFNTIFFQPVVNLVVFLYDIIPGHDLGIVIILFAIIIKLLLLPLTKKQIESSKAMQDMQPKIKVIKEQYKDNPQEMNKKMFDLYKESKVNPLSSCLPILIQLPFLYAIFKLFRLGFENGTLDLVYPFINRPEIINTVSFGLVDLGSNNYVLAVLAGLAQFWQSKMIMPKKPEIKSEESKDENMAAIMGKQMTYIAPVLTVYICLNTPGALPLYWLVSTVLMIVQQKHIYKKKNEDGNSGQEGKSDNGDVKVIEGEIVK